MNVRTIFFPIYIWMFLLFTEEIKSLPIKDWHNSETLQDIQLHIRNRGISGINRKLRQKVETFKQFKINLAIAGEGGSGKSSLVNTLRGLHARQEGAAAVGEIETTKIIKSYNHPSLPYYTLFDVPGVNSPNFPKHRYIYDVDLDRFDCIIICSQGRFKENDLWLAGEAWDRNIPYMFIRTHVDNDIENAARDEGDDFVEKNTLHRMHFEIKHHLSNSGLPTDVMFLISTRLEHTEKWDYPSMKSHLVEKLPNKAEKAFKTFLISTCQEAINSKLWNLQKEIPDIAFVAAVAQGVSGTGESHLKNACNQFKKELGLPWSGLGSNTGKDFVAGLATRAVYGAPGYWYLGPFIPIGMTITTVFSTLTSYEPYKETLMHELHNLLNMALSECKI